MSNTFSATPLVRVEYSFPDVDDGERRKIYDIIFDNTMTAMPGGGGDGSTNSGVMFVAVDEAEAFKQRLTEAAAELKSRLDSLQAEASAAQASELVCQG